VRLGLARAPHMLQIRRAGNQWEESSTVRLQRLFRNWRMMGIQKLERECRPQRGLVLCKGAGATWLVEVSSCQQITQPLATVFT
jgi:hypothetical protein